MSLQSFADTESARLASLSSFRVQSNGFAKRGVKKAVQAIERRALAAFPWMDELAAIRLVDDIKSMARLEANAA